MRFLASMTSAILALVFLLAGCGKLLNQPRTRRAIIDLGAPPKLAPSLGALLPLAELATGILLLIPSSRWYGGSVALVLLAIFLTAMAKAYRDGVTADCACFGRETKAGINAAALSRNVILIGLALVALISARSTVNAGAGGIGIPLVIAAAAGFCTLILLRRETVAQDAVIIPDGPESPFHWPLENQDSGDESRALAAK